MTQTLLLVVLADQLYIIHIEAQTKDLARLLVIIEQMFGQEILLKYYLIMLYQKLILLTVTLVYILLQIL